MTRGIPVNQFVRTNVVGYYCTGADQATLAQPDTANYRCVGTDGYALFNPRFHRNPVSIAASWCQVVGQDCVRSKKNVVTDVNVLPYAHAVFDRHIVTDCYSALDESMVADIAVGTDHGSLQDVSERPNARAFADVVCFYQRLLVDECRLSSIAHDSQFTLRLALAQSYERCRLLLHWQGNLWHPYAQAMKEG